MPTHVNAIRKGLVELAKRSTARTLMQEVRDAFPEIEKALAAGASHAEICQTFEQNGVHLTKISLNTYLHRLRKERAEAAAPKALARKTNSRGTR